MAEGKNEKELHNPGNGPDRGGGKPSRAEENDEHLLMKKKALDSSRKRLSLCELAWIV